MGMGVFKSLDISASALTAQSLRMDVITQNIANANTTRTPEGGAYQRKVTVLGQQDASFANLMAANGSNAATSGVEVVKIETDQSPFNLVYDPENPDANAQGYVEMPNVDLVREYVDMISATRSYEANVTVMNATKQMAAKALEIGK
jgi:flagellar basal-body rod protein FlgC